MTEPPTEPIRIANCSGFFGDRASGALDMVEGGLFRPRRVSGEAWSCQEYGRDHESVLDNRHVELLFRLHYTNAPYENQRVREQYCGAVTQTDVTCVRC